MSKRDKLIDRGKDLLIVLLTISAIVLIGISGYFSSLYDAIGVSSPIQSGTSPGSSAADGSLTQPISISRVVLSSAEGAKYAAAYDSAEVSEVFDSFSAGLGEALGSAGTPKEVSENMWKKALTGPGVAFDFLFPQPLNILASQLGLSAGGAADYSSRFVCLECSGATAVLYFLSADDGLFYSCSTALSAQALVLRMDNYLFGNAFYAFEDAEYSGIYPYTLIISDIPNIASYTSASSVRNGMDFDALFEQLGFNSYFVNQYPEADGTIVYVENGKNLRVYEDGIISFHGLSGNEDKGMAEAISSASAFINLILGQSCGSAQPVLSDAVCESDGEYTINFEYCINGMPVILSSGPAASITVSGGEISRLEMIPRTYSPSETVYSVLPMLQVSAIAAQSGGGEPILAFIDSGPELKCQWVNS